MLVLRGAPALSAFRHDKLLAALQDLVPDITALYGEFYHFAVEKIKSQMVNMNLPNYDRIKTDTSAIIDRILSERLGHAPNSVEIDKMLDGERYEIAREIAKKIGVLLDDAVYLKFKKKPKKYLNASK